MSLQEDTQIICTFDNGYPKSAGTYPTELGMVLSYGYVQTLARGFSIQKR